MSDDTSNPGEPDRSRINPKEDYEIRYWTEKWSVSKDKLAEAVSEVGSSAAKVAIYLGKAE